MADDMADDSPAMEVTKEYFDKVRSAYVNQGQIGQIGVTASLEAQANHNQRDWYLSRCVDALREANKIRRDEKLMQELREFIRRKRDELAITLDEIG